MTILNAQGPTSPVDFDGYNTTGSTIPAGSAVRIDGAAAHPDLGYALPTIALAMSDLAGTMPAIGITLGDISDGGTGTVRQWGTIAGIDTSSFAVEDPLYVSDTVPGGLDNATNAPVSIGQRVGTVLVADASAGVIFVCTNQEMDGYASYTNRQIFEINSSSVAASLRMSASGGEIVLSASPTGNRLVVLPDDGTTLIGNDTTDTLTNKTFDTAGAGNSLLINGLAATANTGTGAVVRADSPTITTKITLPNDGLHIHDTDASHDLIIACGNNLFSDSTLTISCAASRTLTIAGSTSINGTNTGDQTITLTGDVTGTGTGLFAATIANNAVSMAKLADINSQTIIGRGDAGSGDPAACTLETGIQVTAGEVFKAAGRMLRQTLYTSGSGTHTPGADCNFQDVEAWGGGGGGGGADNTGAGQAGAGGGGAAGGKVRKFAAVSGTYSYVIPAAASGGAAGNNVGATGGDVTFTGTNFALVAKGGIGGSGGASTTTSNANAGGSGVISTGGDLNGGGANGTQGAVINGSSGIAFGGVGGTAEYGRGGGGRVNHGAGIAANGIGNGGGGAVAITASTPRAGGDGTAGGILVTEYS